jgi:hypothetical protein
MLFGKKIIGDGDTGNGLTEPEIKDSLLLFYFQKFLNKI